MFYEDEKGHERHSKTIEEIYGNLEKWYGDKNLKAYNFCTSKTDYLECMFSKRNKIIG